MNLLLSKGFQRHVFESSQSGNVSHQGLPLRLKFVGSLCQRGIQRQETLFYRFIEFLTTLFNSV